MTGKKIYQEFNTRNSEENYSAFIVKTALFKNYGQITLAMQVIYKSSQ